MPEAYYFPAADADAEQIEHGVGGLTLARPEGPDVFGFQMSLDGLRATVVLDNGALHIASMLAANIQAALTSPSILEVGQHAIVAVVRGDSWHELVTHLLVARRWDGAIGLCWSGRHPVWFRPETASGLVASLKQLELRFRPLSQGGSP